MMTKDNQRVYNQNNIEELVMSRLKEQQLPITKGLTKAVVDTLWDVFYDALADGYIIKLHGKGQFYLSKRSPRIGRNPRTGVEYKIPEREIMAYRVSDALSKRLQEDRYKRIQL